MAVIKAVNSKSSIAKAINYISKEEKTEEKLISGIGCNPKTAIDEMRTTKELYDKNSGRQYSHFIQSFNPKDKISPEKAHEIGKEFIKNNDKFKDFEILIATHKDKEHIHNHFIINSVNYNTGKKFHTTKYEYQEMKDISNELSRKYGLRVPEKTKEQGKITSYNQKKYKVMEKHFQGKAKSYVLELAIAYKQEKERSISKDDFIEKMEKRGYGTNWTDTRKHITFIDKKTKKKVRLANLEKTFNDKEFTKGGLVNELERNFKERENSRSGRVEGTKDINIRDKAIKQPYEELYQSADGFGLNQSSIVPEGNTGHRGHKQADTRSDDLDLRKAKEHIEESARRNERSLKELSKPDARTREIEHEKARELERANRREHERRNKLSRSKNRGISR